MTGIPRRLRPDPIPKINPVWEFQATGDLKQAYEDYKAGFQVPWVGVVSMAFAHYRSMFDAWWAGVKPLVVSKEYIDTVRATRAHVEKSVKQLSPPPIAARLKEAGYSPQELDQIRDMIEFLSHGNFTQMAVFLFRHLLEGGEMTGEAAVTPFEGSHAVEASTPFVLLEPHHATPDIRDTYQDVMARLNLPFVNTDYRALSRWPSYFAMAWDDLKRHIGTDAHEALAADMRERMFEAVAGLPNPGGLTSSELIAAAEKDAPLDEILEVTKLFTWLIPGLTVNVAFFREQLQG